MLDQKINQVAGTTISSYNYTVNELGQRTAVAHQGAAFAQAKTLTWSYDPQGQLVAENSTLQATPNATYQYDRLPTETIGNRGASASSPSSGAPASTAGYQANPYI